jgi:hypothetical protein
VGPFHRSLATAPVVGKVGGKPGKTLGGVVSTLEDVANTFLFEQFSVGPNDVPGLLAKPGLVGGLLISNAQPGSFSRALKLVEYSDIPGLTLSGSLTIFPSGLPIKFQGTLTVAGDAAANGTITLRGSALKGRLGGKAVSGSTGNRGIFERRISGLLGSRIAG